ncbi:hypothetical protein [Crateriforma conspicua]|uniref:Uncharacterized protein n=1 Tax=Crateriforma conspicua TaxID=2527996 RepID=A0A5C5Y1P0_9PLAN|nr:hypothetical protein [Crateriforma conspicua]QDV62667.1 hypothetical protein Mal65_18020 [Crateriforma conspicua]TWT68563.1 hypothetical protein Pan14r_08090 [Crateriforma conspicua]
MSSGDFRSRLESAIQRGQKRAQSAADRQRKKELSEDELRRLHTSYRLNLSDRIERAVTGVADHFPGFRQESLFGENGWGTACYRDDLKIDGGRRTNLYSRLEIVIRPFSDAKVLDMKAKGTVGNREIFNRSFFADLVDVDEDEFAQLIDTWAIEFAELYASNS